MLYFARIPCIIDGNDAKNTEKGDYKAKTQNLKNPDLTNSATITFDLPKIFSNHLNHLMINIKYILS